MAARPLLTVYNAVGGEKSGNEVPLPSVFLSPLRHDVVKFVHACISKNRRQAYGVSRRAGHQHSAESWGTGRAVARVPRVSGGGTHRSGQAAYANSVRGGRMFAPTKTWRRWHVAVPRKMRRLAVASALAATAVTPLVLARGHRIEELAEVPLVVSDAVEKIDKTKAAVQFLKAIKAYPDVLKSRETKAARAGKGKSRDRKWITRKGPLIVYKEKEGVERAFKNIPGVDTCCVTRLNLLKLAPGGHLGRFIIWSESAIKSLDGIYGTGPDVAAPKKHGFRIPRSVLLHGDVSRVIQSTEVQRVLRPKHTCTTQAVLSRNPLRSFSAWSALNPLAAGQRAATRARSAKARTVTRSKRRHLALATRRAAAAKQKVAKKSK